jgi:hypothetical protein
MAYYIFLKSLRSLEEFRKNPHVKTPPKSSSTNFQSLGKFKNPIFNSEILFFLISARPTLRPTRPLSPASPLATLSFVGQKHPTSSSSPRVGRVFAGNTFSFSDHAFSSRSPPPSVTATWAPLVSSVVSPMPLTLVEISPHHRFPHAAASRLGCLRAFTALPHHFPLLIPFKPSVNSP